MNHSHPYLWAALISLGAFAAMLLCIEVGFRLASRAMVKRPAPKQGSVSIETATFTILSLFLGFSFSQEMTRFDVKRDLVVNETNAIETAYLRIDLLPDEEQPTMRKLFGEYIDTRIHMFADVTDRAAVSDDRQRGDKLANEIWASALHALRDRASQRREQLVLPPISAMRDAANARNISLATRLPWIIFALLGLSAGGTGLVAGAAMVRAGQRQPYHMAFYAFLVAMAVFAVRDLDDPLSGLIRIGEADRVLEQLRDTIHGVDGER